MSVLLFGWLSASSFFPLIASVCLHLSRVASAPIMMSTIIATPAISSSPSKNTSPFEDAKRWYKLTFAAYVASLVLAAGLTYLAGRSADRVAGLAQADANRRIAESSAAADLARAEAARANEGAAKANANASGANERAKRLEADNIGLRGKVAALEIDLTQQRERTAKLELDAATQQERAATAERLLLELKEKMAERRLTAEQSEELTSKLRPFSGQTLNIMVVNEFEPMMLSDDIAKCLTKAGWKYGIFVGIEVSRSVKGIAVELNPEAEVSVASVRAAQALAGSLREVPLAVWGAQYRMGPTSALSGEDNRIPGTQITLIIGKK
jgi:hypothetical protein